VMLHAASCDSQVGIASPVVSACGRMVRIDYNGRRAS
jgi:hypothetical protein